LAKCLFKAAERIVSSEPAWSQDLTIAVQVAASVLMATGTALPEDIRDLAVEAGINGRWHDDAERDRVIDAYLACLRDYRPDEPVVLDGQPRRGVRAQASRFRARGADQQEHP
jgi:hypothetical protein